MLFFGGAKNGHRIAPNPDGTIESYCVTSFTIGKGLSRLCYMIALDLDYRSHLEEKKGPLPQNIDFLGRLFYPR